MRFNDEIYPWSVDNNISGDSIDGEIFKYVKNIRFDCEYILDASIISVVMHCSELKTIDLSYCANITDASIIALIEYCPHLQVVELSYCDKVTVEGMLPLARRCCVVRHELLDYLDNLFDDEVEDVEEVEVYEWDWDGVDNSNLFDF